MCGIVGVLVFKNSNFEITEPYLIKMRDTMIHRGPDSAGLWISEDRKVGLAHRRLSIIDLSPKANQPMCNEDGSVWIVFNGEIYNYAKIRKELEEIGNHIWKTDHSDTEVILHAFEEWGIECVHKFRGMFAFAIWDGRKKELWLVRDRIGIKPLYYTIQNGRIIFASEIKAILEDSDLKREVNERAFYDYLSFLTTPAPDTLFEGIKKLPNGTCVKVDINGNIKLHKYWDVWDYTKTLLKYSEEEILEMLIQELRNSVQLRKVSDVPVGVFLSGGIDSSTNAVLFAEGETNPIKTFSIGYKGEYKTYVNEFKYARLIAKEVGSEHYEKTLTVEDLLNFLPDLIFYQDEPIADPVCIPVYYVSKLARDNSVIVCQVGEGSDELFCGYPYWMRVINFYRFDSFIPNLAKKAMQQFLCFIGKSNSRYYELLRRSIKEEPLFWGGAEAFTETEKFELISKGMKKKFNNYTSLEAIMPIYKTYQEKAWEKTPLAWMSYLDLNLRLPELLLMRVDKMSMAVSLEARVPFLDHKFVELAMSIPQHIKIKKRESKYILKKAVKNVLPKEIISRKKQGFGVPVYEWFFDKLGTYTEEKIKKFNKKYNYFDNSYLNKLLNSKSPKLWYILNFVLWFERWIEENA